MSSKSPGSNSARASGRKKDPKSKDGTECTSNSTKGVQATPEIVYKMSKKIAQLTKVIYYLNTKNEDHVNEIQMLSDSFEKEMNEISMVELSSSKIQEISAKCEEEEARCRAQEEVIESYMEKMENFQQDIRLASANDARLNNQIKTLNDYKLTIYLVRERKRMEEHLQSKLDDLSNRVDIGKHDEEVIAMRNHYEDRIKAIIDDHENAVTDINRRFVGE
ncbi:hypothetical protein HK096_001705, partial [Nowakowskiella sp. JEL0078]